MIRTYLTSIIWTGPWLCVVKNFATLPTADVSKLASISSNMYNGDGNVELRERANDKAAKAFSPPGS